MGQDRSGFREITAVYWVDSIGRLSISEEIAAPPERVFALAADLAGAADRIEGIVRAEVLTEGPVGVGTRWRETRAVMGRESTEELTVTRFDPPRSYTAECESCGCLYASTLEFTPRGDGARLTMTIDTKPITLMAKLMSPLGALFAGGVKKMLAADLADLRRAAEREARV